MPTKPSYVGAVDRLLSLLVTLDQGPPLMLFNALKDRDALKRKAHLIDVLAAHPIEIEVHMPRSDGAFQYYGRSPRDHAAWNWNFFAERSDSPLEVLEAWARCVDAEGGK